MLSGEELQKAYETWVGTLTDEAKSQQAAMIERTRVVIGKLALALQCDHVSALPNSKQERLEEHTSRLRSELLKPGGDVFKTTDTLYSFCLQYGIIGLSKDGDTVGKVSAEAIAALGAMQTAIARVNEHVPQAIEQMNRAAAEQVAPLAAAAQSHVQQLQADLGKLQESGEQRLKAITEEVKAKGDAAAQALEGTLAMARDRLATIEAVLKSGQEGEAATQAALKAVQVVQGEITKLREMSEAHQKAVAELLPAAMGSCQQLDVLSASGRNAESEIKAKLNEASQAAANLKELEGSIKSFYERIEQFKSDMAETKRKADANQERISAATQATLEQYRKDTAAIIDQNKNSQQEIVGLLAGATSAGLFHEFNERARALSKARRKWERCIWLLIVLTGALLGFLIYEQSSGGDWGAAFALRLSFSLPIAAAFYFAASQFAKERRLEEEYAFKATISRSLTPYRDLLEKLRGVAGGEVDFVRHLMLKAFKNPARVVYREAEEKEPDDGEVWPLPPADRVVDSVRGGNKAARQQPSN